jgi:hypothetical protein
VKASKYLSGLKGQCSPPAEWEVMPGAGQVVLKYRQSCCDTQTCGQLIAQGLHARRIARSAALHSLRGVRQWYLILLARWTCQESRGTSCFGLMPRMMSCRQAGMGRAGKGRQPRQTLSPHHERRDGDPTR